MKHPLGYVYLVDDEISIRESLVPVLEDHGFVVQAFSNPADFLDGIEISRPAVILLDMRMPRLSGLEVQSRLRELSKTIPIIFISGKCGKNEIVKGFKEGAQDFLLKPFDIDVLLEAVNKAISLDLNISSSESRLRNLLTRLETLTHREREVFEQLAKGLMSVEVASCLDLSPKTVKIHKSRILEKMGVSSVQELAILFFELGLHQINSEVSSEI